MACIGPRQFVPEVSFTLCNKVILPPPCCAREPDSVTQRRMTTTLACGPEAITYAGRMSAFYKCEAFACSPSVCLHAFGLL